MMGSDYMQDSIEVRSEVISGILEGKCGVGDGLFRVYDLVYTLVSAVSDEALASLSVQKNLDALSFAVWDCAYMGAYLRYCKSGAHGHPGAEQLMKMGPGQALGVINEFAGKHGLTATPISLEQAAQYLDRIDDDLDTAEAVEADVNSSPDMDDGGEWDEDTEDEDWDDEELIVDGSDGWGDGWDTGDGDADTDVAAEAVIEAADEQTEEKQSNGYDHELHYRWFENLLSGLQGAWKDMYGNHVDGLETLNGFVVPGGVIGRSAGVLKNIRGAQEVVPNSTFGNILWEELVGAARSNGIKLDAHVSKEANSISAFQYNPSLQRLIASGDINAKAFSNGWKDYSDAIMNSMPQLKEELELQAVRLDDGGSLTDAYSVLSPFLISMAVVNEKRGLGGQLRICCGDLNTDRARAVANSFMNSVNRRERSGGSTISAGKFSLESPVVSENGVIVISFYYDKARYFSVPDFLGQLLVNLDESQFKPSPKNILLGRKLDNSMMTMNLEASGW